VLPGSEVFAPPSLMRMPSGIQTLGWNTSSRMSPRLPQVLFAVLFTRTLVFLDATAESNRANSGVYAVAAFGAQGDGTSNDGPAIQNALDGAFNAGGGIVRLDCGRTYLTNQTLLIDDHVTLEGCGQSSVIKRGDVLSWNDDWDGTSCAARTGFENTKETIRNRKKDCAGTAITLRDFAIDGSSVDPCSQANCSGGFGQSPSVAITMSGVTDLTIDNLYVKNVPQDGI